MNLSYKYGRQSLRGSVRQHFTRALAGTLIALASTSAMAAIVCGPGANMSVPNTFDGFYVNFITGASGTTGGSVPNWDWNPYNSGTALSFFWNQTPADSRGGVTTDAATYAIMTAGQSVGPSSSFLLATAATATAPWRTTGTTGGYLGIRLYNETTSTVNYGWAQLNVASGTGFPATLVRYCYENTGAAITVGTTPVSLQNFSVD